MSHSTKSERPQKPYDEFPLFPHRNGQWAKQIHGTPRYFGSWKTGTWQEAFERYKKEAPHLYAGNEPPPDCEGMTVKEAVNRFLHYNKLKIKDGSLKERTWKEYQSYGLRIRRVLGDSLPLKAVGPESGEKLFEDLAQTHKSPDSLEGDKAKVMVFFNYFNEQEWTERPIKLGPLFKRASRKVKRRRRAQRRGHKWFEPEEIRRLIEAADPRLKAMILLAINCGFGNTDCATLPLSVVDLDGGWIDYSRVKTGVQRRCPLWPETVAALRAVLEKRKSPKDEAFRDRVFTTIFGGTFEAGKCKDDSPISKRMATLLKKLGLQRKHRNFYSLRHTFYTVGKRRSKLGAQIIMGHADADEAADLGSQVSDDWYDEQGVNGLDRVLLAVSEHVRQWLFTNNREPEEAAEVVVAS